MLIAFVCNNSNVDTSNVGILLKQTKFASYLLFVHSKILKSIRFPLLCIIKNNKNNINRFASYELIQNVFGMKI